MQTTPLERPTTTELIYMERRMQHVLYTEADHKLCARVLLSLSWKNFKTHPRTRAGATEPTCSALILRKGLTQCTVVLYPPPRRPLYVRKQSSLLTPACNPRLHIEWYKTDREQFSILLQTNVLTWSIFLYWVSSTFELVRDLGTIARLFIQAL